MLVASDVEVRAGARLLLEKASLQISAGDKIGLVGRNGSGKTTLTRILAGEAQPAAGTITRTGDVGYLPQDSRTGDLDVSAADRILSARGLDDVLARLRQTEQDMAADDEQVRARAMDRYPRLEARLTAAGGYAAESEGARIASSLGLENRVLDQPLRTLSGGQRRRIELARILFAGPDTMLLDEPTNHLDADSVAWLRSYLAGFPGGLLVISHDVDLLDYTVNKVLHLDAQRTALDTYAMGWRRYLQQRAADEERRRRERKNAERKADRLLTQADRFGHKSTKAVAAKNMARRAQQMLADLEPEQVRDKVAKIKLPEPKPCGRTPLTASELTKTFGSLEVFAGVDLAIDRGSRVVILGLNGAGKTTLLRILAGSLQPDTGEVHPGYGLKLGYYAQEHETLDGSRSVLENMKTAAPDLNETGVRTVLGSFLFSGEDVDKPGAVLSGGEKTRLALAILVVSSANVLLLDEPTNNLDPASREEILNAIRSYTGAIVLVTHDEGAVQALEPDRVLVLPDGTEDLWTPEYAELITLA